MTKIQLIYYKKYHQRKTDLIAKLKNKPCVDCWDWFDPCQMDFDHLDNDKLFNISRGTVIRYKERLMKEISKCELVCANCHRLRTHKRFKYVNRGLLNG